MSKEKYDFWSSRSQLSGCIPILPVGTPPTASNEPYVLNPLLEQKRLLLGPKSPTLKPVTGYLPQGKWEKISPGGTSGSYYVDEPHSNIYVKYNYPKYYHDWWSALAIWSITCQQCCPCGTVSLTHRPARFLVPRQTTTVHLYAWGCHWPSAPG